MFYRAFHHPTQQYVLVVIKLDYWSSSGHETTTRQVCPNLRGIYPQIINGNKLLVVLLKFCSVRFLGVRVPQGVREDYNGN